MLNFISGLNSKNRLIFDLLVILLFSILLTVTIYLYGIPGGHDMYQHYQFANNYYESIKSGDLYPSWSHLPNYESGDVGVRFYPPLTYYFFAFFRFIAGNWFDASCLMFVFLFFTGSLGIYKWSREWFSENGSLIGALTYGFLPYHFNQLYQGSLLAEFTAASILPFCFLFITRIYRRGRLIDICGLAISYGFLILTHLPTTLMASLAFLVFSLASLKKENYLQTILKLGAAVLGGVALSSFYWIRMVFELDFVKHTDDIYSSQYYSYKANFVFPYLLDFSLAKFNLAVLYIDLLCLSALVLLLFSLFLYYNKTKDKTLKPLGNVLVVTVFGLFMTTQLSQFIWEYVPALSRIQFPWRWLIIFSIGTAFVVSAGFEVVFEYFKTPKRYLSIIMVGLFGICFIYEYLFIMNHLAYYPRDFFISIVEKNKTMPSNECWWTSWTQPSKEAKPGLPRPELLPAKVVLNDRAFTVQKWNPTERTFTINAGQAGQAQIATSYYPHWKAIVNGQETTVTPSEIGTISFPIPAEESEVRVFFKEPGHVITTYYLAGFAWVLMLGFLTFSLFQSYKNKERPLDL